MNLYFAILLLAHFSSRCNSLQCPEFVLEPPPRIFVVNPVGITIRCAALGTPHPDVFWTTNSGLRLTPVPGFRELQENGTMWIGLDAPNRQLSRGTFRCKATNLAGITISRSTTVTIMKPEKLRPQVKIIRSKVGSLGILKCVTNAFSDVDEIGFLWMVQKSHYERPSIVSENGRYIYGNGGTLYILNVEINDSKLKFGCKIKIRKQNSSSFKNNIFDKSSFQTEVRVVLSAMTKFQVEKEPINIKNESPRIEGSLSRSVQVIDGQSFTIPCIATSNPPPKFSWEKDDVKISMWNSRVGPSAAENELWIRGPILGSKRARPDHSGSYSCIAANAIGSDRLTFKLGILEHLKVSILPQQQTVEAGARTLIRCTIYGSPVAEIRWYHNGISLNLKPYVSIRDRELVISSSSEQDAGVYQCIAANSLGEAQGTSFLQIKESKPKLIHKFSSQTLKRGASITLTCSTSGYPTPLLTWYRDGTKISSISQGFTRSRLSVRSWADDKGHMTGELNITSVTVLDGGMYKCVARNYLGQDLYSSKVNVYGPPTSRLAANITAVNKGNVKLSCPVAGYPLLKVVWRIDSRSFVPTQRRYVESDGSLRINDVDSSQDSRRYTCMAYDNTGATVSSSFILQVLNKPVLAELKFPDNLYEGMRLSVLCTLLEGDVPISIKWSREGTASLPQDPTVSQSHSNFFSTLIFTKLQGKHSGRYTCTASNSAGFASVSSNMNIKASPWWVVEPENVETITGDEITLECHASATPMPTITWKKVSDENTLAKSPVINSSGWRVNLPRPGTLIIRQATQKDAGRYVCNAENGVAPSISKIITVKIFERAKIMGPKIENGTRAFGSNLDLLCTVDGDLPITYVWSKDENIIYGNPSSSLLISVNENGKTSTVNIQKLSRSDAGMYTCKASNKYGTDFKTFIVKVVDKPDPPSHVHILQTGSREVSLAWTKPFDGNSDITKYVVRFWPKKRQDLHIPTLTLTVKASDTSADINGLKPGTEYQVEVVAYNTIGKSRPSNFLNIQTTLEAPDQIPLNVKALALKQGEIQVSWQFSPAENISFQVGHRTLGSNADYMWTFVRDPRRLSESSLRTEISALRHFTSYEVTVRAVNSVGVGPGSFPIVITTRKSEPSDYPHNIKCSDMSSRSLRIKWDELSPDETNGPIIGYKLMYRQMNSNRGLSRVKIEETRNLETSLRSLKPFSNYSIRIRAYNDAGQGPISKIIICSTLEEKPGPPADIKILHYGQDSVVVSWLRPTESNGEITHYTIYYRPLTSRQDTTSMQHFDTQKRTKSDWEISTVITGLKRKSLYEFWIRATNRLGEGSASKVVSEKTITVVPARIKSFGQRIEGISGHSLRLPCSVIGVPKPTTYWSPYIQTMPDNSLHFPSLHIQQSGNYSCEARNMHGRDSITWTITVVSPPNPTVAHMQYTTHDSIHLSWSIAKNREIPVTGFVIEFREAIKNEPFTQWQVQEIDENVREFVLKYVKCGTTYHLRIKAVNSVGVGKSSQIITTRTRGSVPRSPKASELFLVNSTAINIRLYTWPNGGCPINGYLISYRKISANEEKRQNIPGTADTYVIADLLPTQWYEVEITVRNSAGSLTVSYHVATIAYDGATISPEMIIELEKNSIVPSYLDPHVIAPVVSGIACTLALLLCITIGVSQGCLRNRGNVRANVSTSESKSALFFKKGNQSRGESMDNVSLHHNTNHEEIYESLKCLSKDQTLPMGSALPRIVSSRSYDAETDVDYNETIYECTRDSTRTSLMFFSKGLDYQNYGVESSTESNEDISSNRPLQNLSHFRQPFIAQKSTDQNHKCSIYTVDGEMSKNICDNKSFEPISPPSEFTEKESRQKKDQKNAKKKARRTDSPVKRDSDYSIHV